MKFCAAAFHDAQLKLPPSLTESQQQQVEKPEAKAEGGGGEHTQTDTVQLNRNFHLHPHFAIGAIKHCAGALPSAAAGFFHIYSVYLYVNKHNTKRAPGSRATCHQRTAGG